MTFYTTRCRHFLSFFLGHAKNLGICEVTKDSSGASSKKREEEGCICGLHLEEPLDLDSLQMRLSKDADSNLCLYWEKPG